MIALAPGPCPNCGSARTRTYSSLTGDFYFGECADCRFVAIIYGGEEQLRQSWSRMGEWRERQWQPIKTAPKDGTIVVVTMWKGFLPSWISKAHWSSDRNRWLSGDPIEDMSGGLVPPSHWMPLPDPPKEEAP